MSPWQLTATQRAADGYETLVISRPPTDTPPMSMPSSVTFDQAA